MPRTNRKTNAFADEVAEVMSTGVNHGPEGLDTPRAAVPPFDDAAPSAPQPPVTEDATGGDGAATLSPAARGAVGRLVAELLADAGLGYADVVERVRARFPAAATSVRSVASTASVLRRKGVEVPIRRTAAAVRSTDGSAVRGD